MTHPCRPARPRALPAAAILFAVAAAGMPSSAGKAASTEPLPERANPPADNSVTSRSVSPGATDSSIEETPIEQAKRRFDAVRDLKQSQTLGGPSALSGLRPTGGLPALDLGHDPVPTAGSQLKTSGRNAGADVRDGRGPAAHQANWLVDALRDASHRGFRSGLGKMERNAVLREKPLSEDWLNGSRRAERGGMPSDQGRSPGSARGEYGRIFTDGTGSGGLQSVAAPNPLQGYMASWMTPRDYALLLGKASKGANGWTDPLSSAGGRSQIAGSTSVAGLSGLTTRSGSVDIGANPRQRESVPYGSASNSVNNPYLAALEIKTTRGASPVAASLPPIVEYDVRSTGSDTSKLPKAIPAPPPPPPSAAGQVPESLKTQTDKKYFPQLKRF